MVIQCIRYIIRLYRRLQIHTKINKFKKQKLNAIRIKYRLPPTQSYSERLYYLICSPFKLLFEKIAELLLSMISIFSPKEAIKSSHMRQVFKIGTKENKLLRKVIIFLFGLILSWLAFFFIYYQLELPRTKCILVSVVLQSVLTLGTPFNETILCVILLMLPTLFSSKTRFIIIGYIFLTIYNIMVPNLTTNTKELINSFSCGLDIGTEKVKTDTKDLYQTAKDKLKSFLEPIDQMIKIIEQSLEEVKENLKKISHLMDPLEEMFAKMADLCDTPQDKQIDSCKTSMTGFMIKDNRVYVPYLCDAVWWAFSNLCQTVSTQLKIAGYKIKEQVMSAVNETIDQFYFKVNHNYTHYHKLNKTATHQTKFEQIWKEFEEKHWYLNYIKHFFSLQHILLLVLSTWILINACLYRFRFLTSDGFDNYYINSYFLKIDRIRAEKGKESLIPLNMKEAKQFIDPWDIQMTGSEIVKIYVSLVLFGTALWHVVMYLTLDHFLFVIMEFLSKLMDTLTTFEMPTLVRVEVEGNGLQANMYRKVSQAINPSDKLVKSLLDCKPIPNSPDYDTYVKIGNYLVIILFSILIESYGLRARHFLAGIFYPNRIPIRAVWLYNNILCRRGDFIKFMRRKLRKKVLGDHSVEYVSFLDRICAQYTSIRIICKLIGIYGKYKHCVVCGLRAEVEDYEKLINCPNNCKGVYCFDCLSDTNNLCSLCMCPIQCAHYDDMSEEQDSSDDDIFYLPKSKDYVYQYRRRQSYSSQSESDDGHDPNRNLRRELLSIAYSDDKLNQIPSLISVVNDEQLRHDTQHEQIVLKDNLSQLEKELNIPRQEILRMKRNAKRFAYQSEEYDKAIVNIAHKERFSILKKEDDQRLVRNSLLMVQSDKKEHKKKSNN